MKIRTFFPLALALAGLALLSSCGGEDSPPQGSKVAPEPIEHPKPQESSVTHSVPSQPVAHPAVVALKDGTFELALKVGEKSTIRKGDRVSVICDGSKSN